MSKEIPISRGKYITIVDDEDFDKVASHKWKMLKSRSRVYAAREIGGKGKWKTLLLHRFLMSAQEGDYVDHINNNTLDNRKENLRLTSNSMNLGNRGKQANNTSGYKGVHKCHNGFAVRIRKDDYVYRLSNMVKDPIEGAKIYDRAALHFYGEFAYLNFPEDKDQYLTDNLSIDYSNVMCNLSVGNYKGNKGRVKHGLGDTPLVKDVV